MRSLARPDSSYESHVVQETRALVESHHPIPTKIALLEACLADEECHIAMLQQHLAIADEKRRARLQSVIDLRRRAVAHLRMTVKSLIVQHEGQDGLDRYHAVGNGRQEVAEGDFPFMQYSS